MLKTKKWGNTHVTESQTSQRSKPTDLKLSEVCNQAPPLLMSEL